MPVLRKTVREGVLFAELRTVLLRLSGRVDALGVYFLLGLVSSVLLFLMPVFLGHPLPFLGMGLMLLGVTLSFLPFAPSFVVGMTGAGRSQRFVRIAGYTAAAAGAAATLLSLLPPLS